MLDSFWGYRRENGRVGVRSHVIVLPVDDLSNAAAEAVARNIKGTLAIPRRYSHRRRPAHRSGSVGHREFVLTRVYESA